MSTLFAHSVLSGGYRHDHPLHVAWVVAAVGLSGKPSRLTYWVHGHRGDCRCAIDMQAQPPAFDRVVQQGARLLYGTAAHVVDMGRPIPGSEPLCFCSSGTP